MSGLLIAIVVLTIILAVVLFGISRTLWQTDHTATQVQVAGQYSPLLTWLKYRRAPRLTLRQDRARGLLIALAEMGIIVLWACWVGRTYFNLDPTVWLGGEFIMGIQSHYIWNLLPQCGACVFWNGFTLGGAPAFVETHGSVLHPLVILATLIWGVINGAKMTIVACMVLVGIAQWWQAKVLGLGRVARLWIGLLAVVGGQLAGRLEMGLVPLVVSLAMCSLTMAAALDLALNGGRKRMIVLAGLLSLTAVAGQGYLQIALAIGFFPALALLLFDERWRVKPVWKSFVVAGGLALLLAAVWIVPLLHFLPYFFKHTDASFSTAQALEYTPLNLVISNLDFYSNTTLGKLPYPYLYMNFIGWIPVLMALVAWRLIRPAQWRLLAAYLVAIGLIYLGSSGALFKPLASTIPYIIGGIRYPALLASVAVPLVLGLAAWGLDLFLKLKSPKLVLTTGEQSNRAISVEVSVIGLITAAMLLWSLRSASMFADHWFAVSPVHPGIRLVVDAMVQAVPPGKTEWLQPPWGEYGWYPATVEANMKIAVFGRPWNWKDREEPPVYVEGTRAAIDPADANYVETVDAIAIVKHPENEYASVKTSLGSIPCRATAVGGNIDVDCQTEAPGQLLVYENSWTGWQAAVDGHPIALQLGQWLTVDAPAGNHHYTFRYRPWDVSLGLLLTSLGLIACLWLWFAEPEASQLTQPITDIITEI